LIWTPFAYWWAERKLPRPLRQAQDKLSWRSTQPAPSDPMQLGEAARRLLDDPTLVLALERVQQGLIERWRVSKVGDVERREAMYHLHCAVEELKGELRQMLGTARGIEARARMQERDAA
jgi:hypothetical protein